MNHTSLKSLSMLTPPKSRSPSNVHSSLTGFLTPSAAAGEEPATIAAAETSVDEMSKLSLGTSSPPSLLGLGELGGVGCSNSVMYAGIQDGELHTATPKRGPTLLPPQSAARQADASPSTVEIMRMWSGMALAPVSPEKPPTRAICGVLSGGRKTMAAPCAHRGTSSVKSFLLRHAKPAGCPSSADVDASSHTSLSTAPCSSRPPAIIMPPPGEAQVECISLAAGANEEFGISCHVR